MWTASIDAKEYSKGILTVRVMYKNGEDGIGEAYQVSSLDSLNQSIKNKLKQLEDISVVHDSVKLGAFVAPADPVTTAYELALQEVSRVKNLVSVGILKDTDAEYVSAITALKVEYAKI
jgi:hypothetical protein